MPDPIKQSKADDTNADAKIHLNIHEIQLTDGQCIQLTGGHDIEPIIMIHE